MMIPKIIHYCWFGRGEMPKIIKKCMKSWKKYCPDWQIVRWDEDSFDINSTLWTKQAYEAKKYAFVADYVRLKALSEMGGVYMDTDQELIKPLDPFMDKEMFVGFMSDINISAGVIGSEPKHSVVMQMLDYYRNRSFVKENGEVDLKPNTKWMTDIMVERGLVINDEYQVLDGVHVYPRTYFCPTSCVSIEDYRSKDTVSLHHWAMTWRPEKEKKHFKKIKRHQRKWYKAAVWLRYLPNRAVRKVFGDKNIDALKNKIRKGENCD